MQQKKNTTLTTSTANSRAAHTIPTLMKRISMLALLLMTFAMGARAADYVFIYTYDNNTYFLEQSNTPTTSFVPNASIYTGNSGSTFRNANGYYIRYNGGLTFDKTTGSNLTINNNNNLTYRSGYTTYYLNMQYPNYNNYRRWRLSNDNNQATAYIVETETIIEFTISGDESISTTGTNNSYTHTNATYYYVYEFNEKTYYSTNPANAASTTKPTSGLPQLTKGYTWSISNNSYATVDPSTGAITVNSLPTTDTEITLTCSVTHEGKTQTVDKKITIIAPKIDPEGITAEDLTLPVDETRTIAYELQPSGAYRNVTFSVADVTIATVNANGVVTGKKAGTTTITLTAKKLNGETSPALTTTINVKVVGRCATPVITIDKSTGNTTITCSTEDATIYYTTDGSDPTTSSTVYNGPFAVTKGTVVKAMATKSGFINSAIASQKNEIAGPTGVSDGVVTLNDLEDHTWTYYSGVDASVDEGNYNTKYAGKLYSPNPRNVKITYKANGGAVSINESETSFVYFKTLEQGATAEQYPYTVISNPFSKRPTGKGFGGWKIVSGGEYINGYDNGSTLPLDQEITFVNLPYPSVNCISAEIELEATWVDLNNIVRRTNTGNYTYTATGGTYETNILVLKSNHTGTITVNSPCTIMMVEPDGSDNFRDDYTFTGNITPNNTGVTKIEFAKWNSTNTLNCNNHNVTVGRGMTTTSQCASYVTGVTGSNSNNQATTYNTNLNYHLKLESGIFTDVSFIAGTENTAGYVKCNGTANQVKGTLGNDYDRANENNGNLLVKDELFLGYRPTYADGNQRNATFKCWIKSGNLCSETEVKNTTFNNGSPNGGYYGDASQVFYVSSGGAQTNIGKRSVYVEGGIIAGIAGGIDANNSADNDSFFLRMTGGQVRGIVYGSGAFAASNGIRRLVITGGSINGWVAAGCNGTDPNQEGGILPSDTYVYVGGTSHIGNTTDLTLNTSSDGNVFGAGSGNSAQATTGQVENSNVVIADNCYIKNNVFGGGNYGYSNATAIVYVTGGEISGAVFGGSNQKQGVNARVNMTGGKINSGVYGGSNIKGTISNNVTMQINGGQVGTSGTPANIHGGGYGQDTRVSGNVEVTLGATNQTTNGVTVYGDVYGGSALGTVNSDANDHTYVTMHKGTINGSLYGGGLGSTNVAANVNGPVKVEVHGGSVKKTSVEGSGGVYGANNINGAPQSAVTVDIYGTDPAPATDQYALYSVYGGGNRAPYRGTPEVTVHGCDNSIEYVYGGGNAASVAATDVTIWGGNVIGNVFGGGNGTVSAADVTGDANTTIHGGRILNVYGGSNSEGNIGGTIKLNINSQAEPDKDLCNMNIDNVYGGGNLADMAGNINVTLGCVNYLKELYGGASNADVGSDINMTITSGHFDRVFGGNNLGGAIKGSITVNIEETGCNPITIGEIYGGGNKAAYSVYGYNDDGSYKESGTKLYRDPVVNIRSFTSIGNVYGGGLGEEAVVTGNPTVNINVVKGVNNAVENWLYNDGRTIDFGDDYKVTLPVHEKEKIGAIGTVFGGGNAAMVIGNTNVNIGTETSVVFESLPVDERTKTVEGADIRGNVYGGGNQADVTGKTNVKVGRK